MMNVTEVKGLSKRKLQQTIQYINQNLSEDLSLQTIATHIGFSQYYFCRLFKESTGLTPYQYIIQQRIERAKQLLVQDNHSIVDVALQVGFANQSHFCQRFRRITGVSPRTYRRLQENIGPSTIQHGFVSPCFSRIS